MSAPQLPPGPSNGQLPQWPPATPAMPSDFAGGPGRLGDVGAEESVDWGRYVSALKRFKWLVLAVIIGGSSIGVFLARRTASEYTSTATVWAENGRSSRDNGGPIQLASDMDSYGWIQVLTSYSVLDSVVTTERLHIIPALKADSSILASLQLLPTYTPGRYILSVSPDGSQVTLAQGKGKGQTVQITGRGQPIGAALGFNWTPDVLRIGSGRSVVFWVSSIRSSSDALRGRLKATLTTDNGNFLRIELTGADPAETTHTLNAVLDRFVAVAMELSGHRLRQRTQILAQQLDSAASRLQKAESELEGFRARVITQPGENTPLASASGLSSTQPTVLSQFFQQRTEAETLKREREAIERLAKDPKFAPDAMLLVPSVRNAPDLMNALTELTAAETQRRQLLVKYTDAARPVQEVDTRIASLRTQTIPGLALQLADALKARETEIAGRIASATRELQAMPNRTINEQRLTREATSLAALYSDVQSRYQSSKLADASATPDVRVLDAASLPTQPSTNQAAKIMMMAIGASVALGLGLAIVLDRLDKRLRYATQVTSDLGLGILGVIPRLVKQRGGAIEATSASQVIEGFRSIRLGLAHAFAPGEPIIFTVSSPGPGDGKSFVCSNLASSFAEAGYSTVLIDGDIRRGELHRMFQANRQPGLTDYLTGSATLEQVVRPEVRPNLSVVPCGTRLFRGPELLGSGTMREFLAQMRSRFQVIIVDSPPLGAAIDPLALSTATGTLLLVLRSGASDRIVAEAKLKFADRLPVRLIGAVLNDVRSGDSAYSYYAYEYGYEVDVDEPAQIEAQASSPLHDGR